MTRQPQPSAADSAPASVAALQAAIDLAADIQVQADVLGDAAYLLAALHGETTALGHLAYGIKRRAINLQGHLSEAGAPPATKLRAARAKESRALILEANSILSSLEDSRRAEGAESPAAKIASDRLAAIARLRIFEAIDAINDALA